MRKPFGIVTVVDVALARAEIIVVVEDLISQTAYNTFTTIIAHTAHCTLHQPSMLHILHTLHTLPTHCPIHSSDLVNLVILQISTRLSTDHCILYTNH